MSGLEVVAVAAVGVLVVTAAMLAAAETSITRVGLARAEALEEDGRRGAGLLRRLIERREQVLSPVLFVVLACHLGAATIVAVMVERAWGVGGVAIAFAVELLVIYVVAEAVPKTFALADPDGTATRLAPLVRALSLFAPLRWLTQGLLALAEALRPGPRRKVDPAVLEEELLAVSQQALASEAIEPEEQKLIASIIQFGDTVAREVMVPRLDMITVGREFRVGDVLEVVILNGFSRIPVSADTIDDIVGVVHAKDLMRAQRDGKEAAPVSTLMREPIFVPETKRIAELMREMQAETFHIAIVVDEYGGTAGLVTLEDLIEELVGEIVDEFDVEQPMIEQIAPRQLRVNGRVTISELEEELDADLPDGDWDTVGGLIFTTLGHVPEIGEQLDVNGFAFTVERVTGRRIARVRISPTATDGSRTPTPAP